MKRLKIILPLFIISLAINAQKPEKIYSIVKVDKPHSFYVEQAELWWKEIEKDNKNERAWFNYYKACRYSRMTFSHCNSPECERLENWLEESKYLKKGNEIIEMLSDAIPNTYTYYMLYKDGHAGEKERLDALLKAYALQPDNPLTYDELVVQYETRGNLEKRAEFNNIWFRSNDLSPGILNYNYNVLMSISEMGILLTFGDNDTFPAWMLQDALGVRKDVAILNVHLLSVKEYRNRIFKKLGIPILQKEYENGSTSESQDEIIQHIILNVPAELSIYVSTPSWKQLDKYEEDLYITGLVMQYSKDNIDNIALLKNNIENKYALDYIEHQFSSEISQSVINRTNVNYLPGLIKLYNHYKLSEEAEKATKIKKLGLLIANNAGEDWDEKAKEIFK